STRTSLGHLIAALRPVQFETTSATAMAPRAVSQAGSASVPVGNKRTDIRTDDRGGADQERPRRPRPADCSSASTTSPSLAVDAAACAARSLVLATRVQTA